METEAAPPSGTGSGGRRALLRGGLAGGGLAAGASVVWALAGPGGSAPAPVSSVIPPDDDLMREHGILKRVLLCYREMSSRIRGGDPVTAPDRHDSALIIHDYIEGFHEGLEEGFVFPRLRRDPAVAGTVTTLLVQHARGRVLTQFLLPPSARPFRLRSSPTSGSTSPSSNVSSSAGTSSARWRPGSRASSSAWASTT
jgi:hypothetical protein